MEQQVLELLRATQLAEVQPRLEAELRLKQLYTNEAFVAALVIIGAHKDIVVNDRLAALINLKLVVGEVWSPSLDDFAGKDAVSDGVKAQIRDGLLAIVFDGGADSKVISATAAVVTKIAKADFPEAWPGLLDSLLGHVQKSNDAQVQGILVVLSELVQGGIDEDQFVEYANVLVKCLHDIAVDASKKLTVRAHAVNIFRLCWDFVDTLRFKDENSIKGFAKAIVDVWAPFFLNVVNEGMPVLPSVQEEEEASQGPVVVTWHGVIALKVQVLLTLGKIQVIFPDLLGTQDLFTTCWEALQAHGEPYYASYVDGDRQGGLINIYGLPYTFDSLVIEELDYLQTLLDSGEVKARLEELYAVDCASNGSTIANWIMQVMASLVTFSCITAESEGLWEIDFNVFLSEETFAETNTSPRSACASFVWKICSWLPIQTLESLVACMKVIFGDSTKGWRHKEAALYMLQQIVEEFKGEERIIKDELINACVEHVRTTMGDENPFLRARGHIVMAAIMTAWLVAPESSTDVALGFARQSLSALENDESDIVKTSCIRLFRDYLLSLPKPEATELQAPLVNAIAKFLENQDLDDMDENVDLIDAVLHTLRDIVMAHPATCLDHNGLDFMLTMVKFGAARNDTTFVLIEEAFESAAHAMATKGSDSYTQLCVRILPPIISALDADEPDEAAKSALTDVALNLLKIVAECAINPLPAGFITESMPRLCRIILSDADFYLHQQATLAIKFMLSNDHTQVLSWVDPQFQKGGLEMLLLVIAHLLGPQVDDPSAAEVGELAVEVVEKAGPEALGPAMRELFQVIAGRLSTAQHPGLIQSLVIVFARLSIVNAQDVLNFLGGLQIGQSTALEVVITKWLESSVHFVGFEAIRQNMRALTTIYELHDPRLATLQVHGDLIIDDNSSRIKTRSQAKFRPIQFTVVPAELKIIKLLVNELMPYKSNGNPILQPVNGHAQGRRGSDESWESESGTPDLSPITDDVVQKLLLDFFMRVGSDPHFQNLYAQITEAEKARLMEAAQGHQAMEAQKQQLAAGH